MKSLFIISLTIMTPFFTNNNLKDLENDHYTVIKKIDNIEIREFKNLIYASYTPKDDVDRNNSFRNIAGYIFGGNNRNEEIAMTSPVVIKLHNQHEMAFIMPDNYNIKNLPTPKNKNIHIYEEKSNTKACIRYSGYSNSKTEEKKINELKNILKKYKINHQDDFEVLVYNSPWRFINRRNEIIVSVEYQNNKKSQEINIDTIYFGGGCFWCTEAIFEDVIGVKMVTSGYSGGTIKNPSYREVSKGITNHAEVCEIMYDNEQISLEGLLEVFFLSHDPTTVNRQGNDIGKHYRSIILYNSNQEKILIEAFINRINKEIFDLSIVTEVKPLDKFYEAEGYHQNYYKQNKTAGYCRAVISPKVTKARKKLSRYY